MHDFCIVKQMNELHINLLAANCRTINRQRAAYLVTMTFNKSLISVITLLVFGSAIQLQGLILDQTLNSVIYN